MPLKEALQGLFTKRGVPPAEQWDHAAQPYSNNPGYLWNRELWLQSKAADEERRAARDTALIEQAKSLSIQEQIKRGKTQEEAERMAGTITSGSTAKNILAFYKKKEATERGIQLKEAERKENHDYIERLISEGRLQRTPSGIRSIIRTK